jgi:hypothetical protein
VAAGAVVLSLAEARHSLEDVYLELIDDDVEAQHMSRQRVAAVMRKEVREFRRTASWSRRWRCCRSSSWSPQW